jgi:hypothetical protein
LRMRAAIDVIPYFVAKLKITRFLMPVVGSGP